MAPEAPEWKQCGVSAATWLYRRPHVQGRGRLPPRGFAPSPRPLLPGPGVRPGPSRGLHSRVSCPGSHLRGGTCSWVAVTHGLVGAAAGAGNQPQREGRSEHSPSQGRRDDSAVPGGAARLRPSVGLAGAHASGAAQGCRVRRRSGSGRQSRRRRGRAPDRRGVSHGASPSHGVAPLSRASPGPREQRRWPLSSSPREVPEAGTHKGLTALVPLPPRPLVSPFLPFIMYFNRVGARRMALIMGGGAPGLLPTRQPSEPGPKGPPGGGDTPDDGVSTLCPAAALLGLPGVRSGPLRAPSPRPQPQL